MEGLGITLPVSQSVIVIDSAHACEVSLGSPRPGLLQCGLPVLGEPGHSLGIAYLGQV